MPSWLLAAACMCPLVPILTEQWTTCRSYILPEDLEHFLPPAKAQQAFDLLDIDQDGRVTLHNIRDAVVQMYQVGPCMSPDA